MFNDIKFGRYPLTASLLDPSTILGTVFP